MAVQWSPERAHVPIPGTYDYIAFYGKRDFTDEIMVRILSWGDYPGLFEWAPNITTRVLIRGSKEHKEEGHVVVGAWGEGKCAGGFSEQVSATSSRSA